MKSLRTRAEVEQALTELGRQLALRDADHFTVVCCGAAALCALGILARRTLDVDTLGLIDRSGKIVAIEEFPAEVRDAIESASHTLGLNPDWFSPAASAVLPRGLPAGALERSAKHRMEFGPCLTVHFMDRIDLVALKMYAALDPHDGRRHIEDLVQIDPTRRELQHGTQWMSAWPSSPEFKNALHRLLDGFDCGDLLSSLR